MRYHYEKPTIYSSIYGITYICDHPVYDRCTFHVDVKNKTYNKRTVGNGV